MTDMAVRPIGHIHTQHGARAATPVQTALNPDGVGRVGLALDYCDGLAELDGFDFVWLLAWLTPAPIDPQPVAMRQVPFLLTDDPRPLGLFAMRGPRRPNPIGLHLVRLVELRRDGFTFAGVDMVDGTPLLDIKPWAAPLDLPFGHHIEPPVRSG